MRTTRSMDSQKIYAFLVGALLSGFAVAFYLNWHGSNEALILRNINKIGSDDRQPVEEISKVIEEDSTSSEVTTSEAIPSKRFETMFDNFVGESPDQQALVNKEALLKTLKYSIEERDQYDPELVDFVKSLIVSPPPDYTPDQRQLEAPKTKTDFSQIGQSRYMDMLLKSERSGFFIEAGAYNGEMLSNTLFFELERDWTGLLVEVIPSLYRKVLTKKRRVHALHACLTQNKPKVAKIRVGDIISGRTDTMHQRHEARVNHEIAGPPKFVYIPCFSVNTILKALGVNKVDYFSLDVEGAELDVLKGLDLKNSTFRSFSIEHNGFAGVKTEMSKLMKSLGYNETKSDGQDAYYLKS